MPALRQELATPTRGFDRKRSIQFFAVVSLPEQRTEDGPFSASNLHRQMAERQDEDKCLSAAGSGSADIFHGI